MMWSNPYAILAALLAGLAAALLTVPPHEQLTRATRVIDEDVSGIGKARGWMSFQARPDAAPLHLRVVVSSAAALAVGLALRSWGGVFASLALVAMPVVAGVATVALGRLEPARFRNRRQRLTVDLPQALELLSACLAAGSPLRQATAAVASSFDSPVADDLAQVLTRVRLGASDAEAWRTLRDDPQWAPAAVDLARSVESGTMMVEVLAHHAYEARSRRRAAMELQAKTVGVKSVLPLMTCFLPAFVLVGIVPTVASAVMNALL